MNDLNKKLNDFYSDIDKEKIWDKISSELDFPPEEKPIKPHRPVMRKNNSLRPALTAAAVIFLTIVVSSFVNQRSDLTENNVSAPISDNFEIADDTGAEEPADEFISENENPETLYFPSQRGWDYSSVSLSSATSYNYSDFDSFISPDFEENYSDDFFVEADILSEADFFLDCTVNEISEILSDGVKYSVTPIHVICPEDMTLPPEVEIISSRSYVMTKGKEYLIPITCLDGAYYAADSSSPKIMLSDGYVLYQNGWDSIYGENAQYLKKEQSTPDDFFYDRMLINEEKSLQGLFDRFFEIKNYP